MSTSRVFHSAEFFCPADGDPLRSVVAESPDAVIVAWHVKPGQEIRAHLHPSGQDTWTILSGVGDYYLDHAGAKTPVRSGDVVVAHAGQVHGVSNAGDTPLLFISVVSPASAGYELVP